MSLRKGTVHCSAAVMGVVCTTEGPTFNCYIQEAIWYGPRVGSCAPLRGSCSHFILPPCDGSNPVRAQGGVLCTPLWALSGFLPCCNNIISNNSLALSSCLQRRT